MNQDQEKQFHELLKLSRLITFFFCLVLPIICMFAFNFLVLHGNAADFLYGFSRVPWNNPLLLFGLLFYVVLGGFFFFSLRNTNRADKTFIQMLSEKQILTSAYIGSLAIYGLLFGIKIGPAMASLSLITFLIPIIASLDNISIEAKWLNLIEQYQPEKQDVSSGMAASQHHDNQNQLDSNNAIKSKDKRKFLMIIMLTLLVFSPSIYYLTIKPLLQKKPSVLMSVHTKQSTVQSNTQSSHYDSLPAIHEKNNKITDYTIIDDPGNDLYLNERISRVIGASKFEPNYEKGQLHGFIFLAGC